MSRLAPLFETLKASGRKALVPYIVAGDPHPNKTVALMHGLVEQGADILEIGVPFSDPMAEGPTIQLAHERALEHTGADKVGLGKILEMVAEFRERDASTPVVLMGYANPIERMGAQVFAQRAAAAGVDGLLTVDMPPEESDLISEHLAKHNIDNVFLIAPTTTPERIRSIVARASGYLYYVSLKGVTGASNIDVDSVSAQVARIKAETDLPITIGFGIKDAASASALAPLAEGVVVGSALVESLAKSGDNLSLIGTLRQALDTLK